jgi:hypothetical protein
MAGRLGHIDGRRRVGHIPVNGLRKTNYAYGFGNAVHHFDSKYYTSTQTDGALITYWKDKINGLEFYQGTAANQPIFRSADANFNNLPCVDFNTNVKRLLCNTNFSFIGTLVVIYKVASFTSLNMILANTIAMNSNPGSAICLGGTTTNVTGFGMYSASGSISTSNSFRSTVEDTNSHIAVITPYHIIIDGVSESTTGNTPWIPTQVFNQMGASSTNTAFHAIAKVPEIISYLDILTESECIRLSGNINSKYAIY